MDILVLLGGLLVAFIAAGLSCARSYFKKGRLRGMEEATGDYQGDELSLRTCRRNCPGAGGKSR